MCCMYQLSRQPARKSKNKSPPLFFWQSDIRKLFINSGIRIYKVSNTNTKLACNIIPLYDSNSPKKLLLNMSNKSVSKWEKSHYRPHTSCHTNHINKTVLVSMNGLSNTNCLGVHEKKDLLLTQKYNKRKLNSCHFVRQLTNDCFVFISFKITLRRQMTMFTISKWNFMIVFFL